MNRGHQRLYKEEHVDRQQSEVGCNGWVQERDREAVSGGSLISGLLTPALSLVLQVTNAGVRRSGNEASQEELCASTD